MCHLNKSIVGLFLVVVLFMGACSAPALQSTPVPSQPTAMVTDPAQPLYDDPFAYCATVGTIDAPDARYAGPEMPASIIQGLIRQGIVSADAPPEFQQSAVWRCMDGHVWVCHFGANLPCLEKADLSQVPTSEMVNFCATNPTAESIPAAVTGRATVYEWKCGAGKPEAGRQVFQVDPQGYLADFWVKLASETEEPEARIEYRNSELGFSFSLPASWGGFSVQNRLWEGAKSGEQGDVVVEQGPLISIVHPRSTTQQPRQDIPIMVFTTAQWQQLQQDEWHIGAAPFNPSELGRNSRYVLALPARYNYAFQEGWEEVEQILQNHPLTTFEPGGVP